MRISTATTCCSTKEGKVWVIDFDKEPSAPPGNWQQANLERLLRSFNKESQLHTQFPLRAGELASPDGRLSGQGGVTSGSLRSWRLAGR